MMSAKGILSPHPEFDEFLYSSIGVDKNGMTVSVLSAFARLDLDAWQEATELTRLPADSATNRLAATLASLPVRLQGPIESRNVAGRLIAFLPRSAAPVIRSNNRLISVDSDVRALIASMVFMGVLLGLGWIAATQQEAVRVDTGHGVPDIMAAAPRMTEIEKK